MSSQFDCADPAQRSAGIEEATTAVRDGALVVFPTDTVYGAGADAFSPDAVATLQAARGGRRGAPPAVLVGSVRAATALTESLGAFGQDLIDEFWPGPLTLVFRASSTLKWDLGDTNGTVAIRMPLNAVALELLRRTGPLAVSSASKAGVATGPAVADARAQLDDAVAVYLDGGVAEESLTSTIVDLTGSMPRVLRAGAITVDELRKVAPVIELPRAAPAADAAAADADPAGTAAADDSPADDSPADAAPSDAAAADAGPADDSPADGAAAGDSLADNSPGDTAPAGTGS
jgi:tRNA threonylcarbamoyl adenosine modification protein (Sua5/YciO/YrdC/YwlC family)